MAKTILLMRHSVAEKNSKVENSLIPLSVEGVTLAKSKREMFDHVNRCYSSYYKRAAQTAAFFSDDVTIVDGLHERIIGLPQSRFWLKQYEDYDFRNQGGESLNEVKLRMKSAIDEILNHMTDGETVIIVSHATAICSYLLNFCKIQVIDETTKSRKITYHDDIVMCGNINPLSCFEIRYDHNMVNSIRFYESYNKPGILSESARTLRPS